MTCTFIYSPLSKLVLRSLKLPNPLKPVRKSRTSPLLQFSSLRQTSRRANTDHFAPKSLNTQKQAGQSCSAACSAHSSDLLISTTSFVPLGHCPGNSENTIVRLSHSILCDMRDYRIGLIYLPPTV